MSLLSVNGVPVISGTISFPLQGTWEAQLQTMGETAPPVGPVVIEGGGATLVGTAVRSSSDTGHQVSIRCVGGAGRLATELPPKPYRYTTRHVLLQDALTYAGETLDTGSTLSLLAPVPRWTRTRQDLGTFIRSVLAEGAESWRVTPSGTVLVTEETWPTFTTDHVLIEETPNEDAFTVACETFALLPGVTFRDRRISSALYTLDDTTLRCRASYAEGRHGMAAELDKFVSRATKHTDLHKPFSGRILEQHDDGTVEVRTHDPDFPDLSRVPLRFGIPGVISVSVDSGTEVVLVHEDGDQQKPVVVGFMKGTASEVQIGGDDELVKHTPLLAWISQLKTAGGLIGLSVPELIGANTSILKGG